MNDTVKLLLERKSVRIHEPVALPEDDIRLILECAVQAPTGSNMSLWSCIRVTDPQLKEELAEHCNHQPFIAKAPLVLIFYANFRRWLKVFGTTEVATLRTPSASDRLQANVDTIIAAQSAVIAAESMGYGTCYIGGVVEHWAWHKERFHLPEHVQPVCMVVIGIPTQQQKERQKPRRFNMDDLVFENTYRDDSPEKIYEIIAQRQGMTDETEIKHWLNVVTEQKWHSASCLERVQSIDSMLADWEKPHQPD